jgi:hypothetical protein
MFRAGGKARVDLWESMRPMAEAVCLRISPHNGFYTASPAPPSPALAADGFVFGGGLAVLAFHAGFHPVVFIGVSSFGLIFFIRVRCGVEIKG